MYANWFFKLDLNTEYYLMTDAQYNELGGAEALPDFQWDEDDQLWYATDLLDDDEYELILVNEIYYGTVYKSTQGSHGG